MAAEDPTASQTPASLASETTPDDSAFVLRSSSLLFGGDVETAVVMAVRRELGYIEPTLEQSETLQGIVCVNWEVIRLCYEAGYQNSACVSARIVCAYTRNTYCACNFHILHVTPDVKIHPRNQENPSNVTRPSSRLRGVGSGDETKPLCNRYIPAVRLMLDQSHLTISSACVK